MNSNGPDEGTPVKVRRGLRIESVVAGLALVISIVSCTTSTYTYRLETEPDIILALSGDHPVQIRVLNRGEGVAESVLFGCSYLAPGSPQTASLWFRNTTPGMPPISKDRGIDLTISGDCPPGAKLQNQDNYTIALYACYQDEIDRQYATAVLYQFNPEDGSRYAILPLDGPFGKQLVEYATSICHTTPNQHGAAPIVKWFLRHLTP